MARTLSRPLLLVGCGKMGGAMLSGWLHSGIVRGGVVIVDPAGAHRFVNEAGVSVVSDAADLPADLDPEVVVLAVKPQQMAALIGGYRRFAGPGTVFVSVAAGKAIRFFEGALGARAAIVRAMPNTPAAIGQGITVACPNAHTTPEQVELSLELLKSVGEAVSVDDESLMDAVTAVSGCGPAYVFLLIECLTEAGVEAGLPRGLAARLSLFTVAGAGQLALGSHEPPATLRENVSSPGGATLEALKVLMAEDGLQPLLTRAIAAAARRSRELAD